jgi:hypothetical protein
MTRRTILAGALFAGPLARTAETVTLPDKLDERTRAALQLRQRSALKQSTRKVAAMTPNSDEATIPNWISCFTKKVCRKTNMARSNPLHTMPC